MQTCFQYASGQGGLLFNGYGRSNRFLSGYAKLLEESCNATMTVCDSLSGVLGQTLFGCYSNVCAPPGGCSVETVASLEFVGAAENNACAISQLSVATEALTSKAGYAGFSCVPQAQANLLSMIALIITGAFLTIGAVCFAVACCKSKCDEKLQRENDRGVDRHSTEPLLTV